MNMSFSLSRFGKLFAKHTVEHYKSYLLSWLVSMGLLLIIFVYRNIMAQRPMDIADQVMYFNITFFTAGALFTSTIFSDLSQSRSAIASLTLPASTLEKFMVKWIYTYFLFQVVFILSFYLLLEPMQKMVATAASPARVVDLFREPDTRGALMAYTVIHALAMFGALQFKKLHFVKTTFIMLIIFVVFMVINKLIVQIMLGAHVHHSIPFAWIALDEGKDHYTIKLNDNKDYTFYWVTILSASLIWAAAYFRLKEKQV